MNDFRRIYTERLSLHAISVSDVDLLYSLKSDPRVWTYFPSGVHTRREQTASWAETQATAWEHEDLGYWTVRLHDDSFVGVGGCTVKKEVAWNLYYRFTPESQGRGLASEMVRAALAAARIVRPELPITASLLEQNLTSKSVADKSGLKLIWRGPDFENSIPGATRLLYSDRELTPRVLDILLAKA